MKDKKDNFQGFLASHKDITLIRQTEDALRKSYDEMELRVRERTKELEQANKQLKDEVAERIRTAKSLETKSKQFNDVLDMLPAYLILLNPDYHVKFANKFFRERFGEDHGKRCYEYLFNRAEPCEICDTFKVLKVNSPIEWEWTGPDGHIYSIFDFPFTDTDGSTLIMEVGIDVTVQKQAQAGLQKSHDEMEAKVKERTIELQEANKELEAFSYSVSHDLRAPLRSMDGFSQAVLEDYSDTLDEQGRNYLRRIRTSSQLMSQLIDDMLRLSRVTRAEKNIQFVNLSEIANLVASDWQKSNPERKVEFTIAPDIKIRGDAHLLRLLLENLIGNACKFTAKSTPAKIEIGVIEKDGRNIYYVRDNGVGFDMAYADKLFKPFQRLHTAAEFPGTGIGLATVQRIIKMHGGKVWAESKEGFGATFYFTL